MDIQALKDKHAIEIARMEDEIADLAKENQEQRIKSQTVLTEVNDSTNDAAHYVPTVHQRQRA